MARNTNKSKIGRDPTMGRLSFKTGTQRTRKDRERDRNDKYGRKLKTSQLKVE